MENWGVCVECHSVTHDYVSFTCKLVEELGRSGIIRHMNDVRCT